MNAFSGVDYLPLRPMASPMSVVDVFFPGFSAVNASVQQLLPHDVNGYVHLLCMGAVFVVFARYAYSYANDVINKYLSRTIHIKYYDETYEMVTNWVQQQPFAREAASLMAHVRTQQQMFCQDDSMSKKPLSYSPWDGSFPFWFKNHRLTYHCRVKDHHEEISISCIGISSAILTEFMEECRVQYLSLIERKVPVFQPEGGEWKRTGLRSARDISTVIMDEKVKSEVLGDMKEFLLVGPPGTGKSSFCLSVAGLHDLDIYILNLSSGLSDEGLGKLFSKLPAHCIVLLEDVDAVGMKRKDTSAGQKQKQKDVSQYGVSLSGLLNVIDGVGSQEGRILIMSTNHVDHLDEALIRPGRVDMTVQFKHADKDIVVQLFCNIFKETPGVEPEKEVNDVTIEKLAEEFATHVPVGEFSPAEVLKFLVKHKNSPVDAVSGVQEWVAKQMEVKESKAKLERENSWVKDD